MPPKKTNILFAVAFLLGVIACATCEAHGGGFFGGRQQVIVQRQVVRQVRQPVVVRRQFVQPVVRQQFVVRRQFIQPVVQPIYSQQFVAPVQAYGVQGLGSYGVGGFGGVQAIQQGGCGAFFGY